MADRYERPDWVRRLNAMGDSVGSARDLVPLDPDDLHARAVASLGIEDLGDFGDPDWRARFDRLTRAIDGSRLHVVGRMMTKQELLRALRTRLRLNRQLLERPEIVDRKIVAPVIVTGPARSGTTILFELLALDPALRAPIAWEALHPLPAAAAKDVKGRLAMTECEQEFWADVQPEFAAIHELRSDLPVECVTLTTPSFCGPHWVFAAPPDFIPDMFHDYRFHAMILKLLQDEQAPRTWLLKTPGHIMAIDLLLETYPDAWVVQTHRDPAKTMPSTVSTTAMAQWLRTDHVDLELLRQAILSVFSSALNDVTDRRRRGALPARFVDVQFADLLREPVDTLRRAYACMERELSPEHAAAVERYLAEKPKGKFGVHRYTPEEWGFSADAIREQLAPYIAHFKVALE